MKTIKWIALLLSLATIIFLTCRNSRPRIVKVDPAYAKYVSGFTGGLISKTNSIKIELAQDYKPKGSNIVYSDSSLPDSSLLKKIFSFEPDIDGYAHWLNSRVIEFVPKKPLRSGELYTVTFNLGRLVDVPNEYRKMEFQFNTWKQSIAVKYQELEAYNQYKPAQLFMKCLLSTADGIDTTTIAKMVKAKQEGRKLPMHWERTDNSNEYLLYFDSIVRGVEKSSVILKWDGDAINAEEKGEQEIDVNAIGDYVLSSAEVLDDGDQKVILNFSDPIFPDQHFERYIQIEGVKEELQYTCNNSKISVYLPTRIIGSRKIKILKGLQNMARAGMAREQESTIEFTTPKPRIKIHGQGTVLPNSQGLRIPLETINLKAVDVRVIKIFENNVHQFLQVNELNGDDGLSRVGKIIFEKKIELGIKDSASMNQWTRHLLDLGNLIKTDIGSIYRVSIRFKASYTGCGCSEEHEAGYYDPENYNTDEDENGFEDEPFEQAIDYDSRYYSYEESGYENQNQDPCSNEYYSGKALNRNILASDLGLIYKSDIEKNSFVFVSNLITAKPSANTTIELYDYTRQLVGSGITDSFGSVHIKPDSRPFLMIAKKGAQRGYLKLTPNNANSLSKFETEGESVKTGLKGFLYGERGVWRPGDSIYLTFMLEHGKKNIPPHHPYTFELTGPNGQNVEKKTLYLKDGDMDVIRFNTAPSAPTGTYVATVSLGNLVVTKSILVETIKPNRLKVHANIPQDGFEAKHPKPIKLEVKWLHGAQAPGLKTQVEMTLSSLPHHFAGYNDYIFESPLRKKANNKSEIFNGFLDKTGSAEIIPTLDGLENATGILNAVFVTRVYENGGDMSTDLDMGTVYPFNNYLGLQNPSGNSGSLTSGEVHTFNIVNLDKNGKPITAKHLKVNIYRLEWKWWYEQENEGEANYLSRPATYLYSDTTIDAPNGKGRFHFGIPSDHWGRYLVVVTDPVGGHECGTIVTFDYPYWGRQNGLESDAATLLTLSTDKNSYRSGENVQVTFPSAAGGRALVSIETGRTVVKSFWVNTTPTETRFSFKADGSMSPNAYVHITLVRPHLQTVDKLPIRMYGLVPIEVLDPSTRLAPVVASANEFGPERTENIWVSESTGKPMYYTLALVDEGLLDLTHFQTPDPHNRFYAKEALGVKTWDIYNNVIGAFGGPMDHLLNIGGDGDYDSENGSKAQRFKPMVKFIGPFLLRAGSRNLHQIKIPNYIGSVRVMLVARNQSAFGQTEKTVPVKQPLMVLASLPRVIGPGETLKIPVTLFAMQKDIRDVKVQLNVQGEASISGNSVQQIHFSGEGEEMLYYEIHTNKALGVLKISIAAAAGVYNAHDNEELEIRSPNVIESHNTDLALEAGQTLKIPVQWFGLKGSNSLALTCSTLPIYGFQNRLDYLIQYPHGCIEQTTSAVFAQLYLDKIMNLNAEQQKRIENNIKAALKKYNSFQSQDGGFSYWPSENISNEWGSNYAGYFMLEAEKTGYALPPGMKDRWITYQQSMAKNWKKGDNPFIHPHGVESYTLIQAERLYLLALAGKAELGAMNQLREENTLYDAARWKLAAAYALVGRKDVSQSLVSGVHWNVGHYHELGYTFGSDVRDKALILDCMSNMEQRKEAENLFKEVSSTLNGSYFLSTQEAAYCLLSICNWANSGNSNVVVTDNRGKTFNSIGNKALSTFEFNGKNYDNGDYFTIKNTGKTAMYLRQVFNGCPFAGTETAEAKGLSMTWKFYNTENKEINPKTLNTGTDFTAQVSIRNTSNEMYREMVLKEIVPGGWEIMDSRLFGETFNPARYANLRDDRVYFYFDLTPQETKVFTLRLHASYEGEFYLPAPYAEAMYDAGIHSSSKGMAVTVLRSIKGI